MPITCYESLFPKPNKTKTIQKRSINFESMYWGFERLAHTINE